MWGCPGSGVRLLSATAWLLGGSDGDGSGGSSAEVGEHACVYVAPFVYESAAGTGKYGYADY